MVGQEENIVGSTASRGLITSRRSISSTGGANAGLHLFGRGRYILGGWCGTNSGVEIWQVEPVRALQSVQIEMQLADMSAGADGSGFVPPGASGNREDWAPHLVPVFDAAVCSTGHRILVAGGRGIRTFELDGNSVQWRKRETYRNHGATVTSCALSLDGEMSISTDQNGVANVWVTETSRDVHRLRVSTVPQCSRFIWQDHMVAVGDDRGRIICWELAGGRRHLQFQTHRGPVHQLHFDTSSGCLITGGADSTARVWNLEQGVQVGSDLQHRGPVHDVSIAMEGRFALTCGADGYLGIWSMRDGRLLDSYFDGSPLFRLSVDEATGTVVIAGGRSIKSLNVDWARLRELASSSSRASAARVAAGGYGQAPAAVAANYLGQPMQAPIGSILAARQTSDLPIAEQSNAIIARPGGGIRSSTGALPVVDGLRGQTGAVPAVPASDPAATQFPSPMASSQVAPSRRAAPPSPTRPVDPFAARGGGPVDPFAPRSSAAADPFGGSRSAPDPFGGRGQVGGTRETSRFDLNNSPLSSGGSGSGTQAMQPIEPPDTSFADGFFDGGSVEPPRAQPTPHHADTVSPRSEPVPEPPAARPDIGGRPANPTAARASLEDMLEGDRVQKFEKVEAPKSSTNTAAAILFLLALIVGFGGREGVYRYYTTSAYPGNLANRPAAIEQDFNAAVGRAGAESNTARAAIEAQIAGVGENGQMTDSEIERVRGRLRRRFDEVERTRLAAIAEAERARTQQINGIDGQRQAMASEVALQYGGAIGGVVLLLGLIVLRALEKKNAPPPQPKKRSAKASK